MKHYLRPLLLCIPAELLTLFLDLTLAFSSAPLLRILCGLCTLGVLLGLMVQAGHTAGNAHRKAHLPCTAGRLLGMGLSGSIAYLLLWGMLLLARMQVLPDETYRIYKLLAAPFLNWCNLLSADISAASLPAWGMGVLLVLSLLPGAAVCIAYRMTMEPEEAFALKK